jgi:hypothetical protein
MAKLEIVKLKMEQQCSAGHSEPAHLALGDMRRHRCASSPKGISRDVSDTTGGEVDEYSTGLL